MKFSFILFLLSNCVLLYGQQITGAIIEKDSNLPVEYVNIGVVGKNIGTVSDQNGNYTLNIALEYHDDTLRFSCIGYHSYSVKVSDFINLNDGNVKLEKRIYELSEVVVRPKKIKQKTLGITTKKSTIVFQLGSIKGCESGILMKNKNKAFLKEVNINVASCSFDSVFYRVNIYKVLENMQFENILRAPIYLNFSKEDVKDKITIDLRHLNLVIDGDFLVSFEIFMDIGSGKILIPASLLNKTYRRETSQGSWKTMPAGMSISALVDVEK